MTTDDSDAGITILQLGSPDNTLTVIGCAVARPPTVLLTDGRGNACVMTGYGDCCKESNYTLFGPINAWQGRAARWPAGHLIT